ncbi:hypothetical protein [Parasutterella excrementihominis]|uniref:hypothetical protein n=1 Tax=Parasutterella excrementihominis TaxID=487175 RepID=UPI0024320812|nr:hypothetical protein [Parasutterella excrementihominis]
MSIESYISALTLSIQENTRVTGELVNLLKGRQGNPEKVLGEPVQKAQKKPTSGAKAGLAEKTETPARADAPEAAVAPTVTEPEPKKEEKAPEVFDADAEKAERSHVCQALFGVLRGKVGASGAKTKTAEIRNAFLGHPFQATDPMDHEQHVKFMAYMNKAIEEAK